MNTFQAVIFLCRNKIDIAAARTLGLLNRRSLSSTAFVCDNNYPIIAPPDWLKLDSSNLIGGYGMTPRGSKLSLLFKSNIMSSNLFHDYVVFPHSCLTVSKHRVVGGECWLQTRARLLDFDWQWWILNQIRDQSRTLKNKRNTTLSMILDLF